MEETSLTTIRIHRKHLETHLGKAFPLDRVSSTELQSYIEQRAKKTGTRGKPLTATTIKKELATFRAVWSWAISANAVSVPFPNQGLRYPKTQEKPPFQTWAEIERQLKQGGLGPSQQAELWGCLFLT